MAAHFHFAEFQGFLEQFLLLYLCLNCLYKQIRCMSAFLLLFQDFLLKVHLKGKRPLLQMCQELLVRLELRKCFPNPLALQLHLSCHSQELHPNKNLHPNHLFLLLAAEFLHLNLRFLELQKYLALENLQLKFHLQSPVLLRLRVLLQPALFFLRAESKFRLHCKDL